MNDNTRFSAEQEDYAHGMYLVVICVMLHMLPVI